MWHKEALAFIYGEAVKMFDFPASYGMQASNFTAINRMSLFIWAIHRNTHAAWLFNANKCMHLWKLDRFMHPNTQSNLMGKKANEWNKKGTHNNKQMKIKHNFLDAQQKYRYARMHARFAISFWWWQIMHAIPWI